MFDIFQKQGCVIWLTGLPAAGKTTVASEIVKIFETHLIKFEWLDGDKVREFFPQSGFTKNDRTEHIHRVGFTAGLLAKHGVNAVVSMVSPYETARLLAGQHCKNFFLIYISTPQSICELRDPKNLYKRARAGEVKNFTGVSDDYEIPTQPFLSIDCSEGEASDKAMTILDTISRSLHHGVTKE